MVSGVTIPSGLLEVTASIGFAAFMVFGITYLAAVRELEQIFSGKIEEVQNRLNLVERALPYIRRVGAYAAAGLLCMTVSLALLAVHYGHVRV
jgi:hypothetical protein